VCRSVLLHRHCVLQCVAVCCSVLQCVDFKIHIQTFAHTHIHSRENQLSHVRLGYFSVYVYIFVCTRVCTYMCPRACVNACMYIYAYICMHACMHEWIFLTPAFRIPRVTIEISHCNNTLQHLATHCNTLQHTATHCNTLQHTTTHCNTSVTE